ncbi:putative zinc-binding metallopeptidase [Martelella sp. HB161492]|uniref:zinc-binding metallopeptidase family protein n=1 Tax=Martelella sp. HB161492 TaxID=2720726 RepID=UPI001590F9A3|nr:putative zinc-binding metallopeptidase [Martelella sp. HB161492]
MKLFSCDHCGQTVYFDNQNCVACGHRLGFDPEEMRMHALEGADEGRWKSRSAAGEMFRFCANADAGVCNWLVPSEGAESYCRACRHNRLMPDIATEEGLTRWKQITAAERHLFYSLMRLGIQTPTLAEDADGGLVFDFLEDSVNPDGSVTPAMTGHDDGLISLRAAEADDVVREIARSQMDEPYRTLLGHFRHEVGHYVWDRLVRDRGHFDEFRAVFGDERADYAAALERHYHEGPPPGFQEHFVSAYATTHPWEDFAESFAHLLHIVDTLETAQSFGLSVDGAEEPMGDPYLCQDAARLAAAWVPLTLAMNAIHRSMGENDFYPFVLTPDIVGKLGFIRMLLQKTA